MDASTTRLVDFATQFEYSALTPETVHACKRTLVDTFACAIGAYHEPLCDMGRRFAQRYAAAPGTPTATIWGQSWKTTPEAAAFANGVMVRFLDINDMYRTRSGGHPSDINSGILAVAEAVHADGKSLIAAITLAYDVYCSFCDAADINTPGWDTPVFGVWACALAAGKLLGLSRSQLADAVALALVPNMATFQTRHGDLSSWKGCAGANGARNGVFAALLAQAGFTGPSAPFEGKAGLWDIIGRCDWQVPPVSSESHKIAQTNMKCFPVCYHGQAAVWTALKIRPEVRVQDISEIEIGAYRMAVEQMATDASRWVPTTRETADHSLPYVVALTLLDGKLTSSSYASERLTDPVVADLIRKTRVIEVTEFTAKYPEYAPCRLKIRTAAGQLVEAEVDNSKGHGNNPLSDRDIEEKFRGFFAGFGNQRRCDAALAALWNLEQVQDIGEVLELFVADS